MVITHKFFSTGQETDFHQFLPFSSNGSLLLLSSVKSSGVTGRFLTVEEFMLAIMAKSMLKHLSSVTGVF